MAEQNNSLNQNDQKTEYLTPEQSQIVEDKIIDKLTKGGIVKKYPLLEVIVENGTVTLFGTVDTAAERLEIEKIVQETEGVKLINNNLQVVEEETTTNNQKNRNPQGNNRK